MVTVTRKMLPAAKSRVRTPVGHRYLEALQAHVAGQKPTTSSMVSAKKSGEQLDLLVLGMSPGRSVGEIDVALCRFIQDDPESSLILELVKHETMSSVTRLHDGLLDKVREDATRPSILPQMDIEAGRAFANAIHQFAQEQAILIDDIDLVGSGGQLVSLNGMPENGEHRSNICLGEGAIISAETGITTVSDFRTAEQAVGRQGSPLFSSLTGLLLHHSSRLQVCISISTIATVCFVPPDSQGGIDAMYDWDTGPGTIMLEAALRAFGVNDFESLDSSLQNGIVCLDVMDEVLVNNEFLRAHPPKTTAAEEVFGEQLTQEIISMCEIRGCTRADIIATLVRLTSASIVQQILLHGPERDALSNADIVIEARSSFRFLPQIVSDLRGEFPGAKFESFDRRTGIPSSAKQAVAFAMQAMEAVLGRALPVPTNAVVRRPNTITGKIAPGLRWREVIEKSITFGGTGRGWEGLPEVKDIVVRKHSGS